MRWEGSPFTESSCVCLFGSSINRAPIQRQLPLACLKTAEMPLLALDHVTDTDLVRAKVFDLDVAAVEYECGRRERGGGVSGQWARRSYQEMIS